MERNRVKKVIILGRKKGLVNITEYLSDRNIEVKCIVTKDDIFAEPIKDVADILDIPLFFNDKEIYKMIEEGNPMVSDIDLVISFLYYKKIRMPLINLGRLGCINFHPALLCDYKGCAGYNTAILDGKSEYGVSAHFIDSEEFDSGPVISESRFPIDKENETAFSLERTVRSHLFTLFKEVIQLFQSGHVATFKNSGGLYWTKEQLESSKIIDPEKDSPEQIDRKIRAFFFPPYSGAMLKVNGQNYTLINEKVLNQLASEIHNALPNE